MVGQWPKQALTGGANLSCLGAIQSAEWAKKNHQQRLSGGLLHGTNEPRLHKNSKSYPGSGHSGQYVAWALRGEWAVGCWAGLVRKTAAD